MKRGEDYTCEACGGVFRKAWSDQEAKAELDQVFAVPVEDCVRVCENCYRKVLRDMGVLQ